MKSSINKSPANPFKLMQNDEKPPVYLKDRVFASTEFATLLLNVGELFSFGLSDSIQKLFKTNEPDIKQEENEM